MRILRTAAVALILAALPHAARAQQDTTAIVVEARRAAATVPVAGYGLAAAVAVPLTLAGGAGVLTGDSPRPWMAAGPALLIGTVVRSGTARLPADLEAGLATMDPADAALFRATWTSEVRRRRRTAMGVGSAAGVAALFFLMRGLSDIAS